MNIRSFTAVVLMGLVLPAHAEFDWISVTLDNDVFVGEDSGYTNGLYVSVYDVSDLSDQFPTHDFWVAPLIWSMPKNNVQGAVNAYSLGQTMSTPSDITIAVPDENELPYSALLSLTNSYLTANSKFADRVSTTVGIIGPIALGEETQTFVHDIIDADEPEGWDTQLENELVFQFSRGRTWRTWATESDNVDVLTNVDLSLGTIQSATTAGMIFRYGKKLIDSFPTTLMNSSRISNPVAIDGGWYFYSGFQLGYIFNQIFADGNTYRDSRSVDYDHEFVAVTAGFAYSRQNFSITFAINDSQLIESDEDNDDALDNVTQYGTLTVAWRL